MWPDRGSPGSAIVSLTGTRPWLGGWCCAVTSENPADPSAFAYGKTGKIIKQGRRNNVTFGSAGAKERA
jgi:hypothetical protein